MPKTKEYSKVDFKAVDLILCKKKYLTEEERKTLLQLWNKEYPKIMQYSSLQDFDAYLNDLENVSHYLLVDSSKDIIRGWAFTFDRNASRWFAIILSSAIQSKGIGKNMIKLLTDQEKELNAWVIDHSRYIKSDGQQYISPLPFYMKCGCKVSPKEELNSEELSVIKIKFES